MAKIGRNEPCPCGSGKKYKTCCLGSEVRTPREFVLDPDEAVDWLSRHHGEAVAAEIRQGFFGPLEGEDFEKLGDLSPEMRARFATNMNDWLLAEGVLDLQGTDISVAELLLSQQGPRLDPELVEWIDALANSSLELYEVHKDEASGLTRLVDVFDPNLESIFLEQESLDPDEEPTTPMAPIESMELVGARLLVLRDEVVLSGALYPFEKRHLAELRRWREEDRDLPTSSTIVEAWVGLLVDPHFLDRS